MDLSMKVLIVDDFSTMLRILKNMLKQIGFSDISEADDGTSALELLKAQEIDLIVCDWNMPQMSGFDLLKEVRSDPDLKDTPFVMVTAEAQRENVIDAVEAGVSNYIVKPFTVDQISEKLEKIFA